METGHRPNHRPGRDLFPCTRNPPAYVGFEFACSCKEEHGLGVLTDQGRPVEIPLLGGTSDGYADVTSEEWIAEADSQSFGYIHSKPFLRSPHRPDVLAQQRSTSAALHA
jgi:hypothetical protein